MNLQLDNVTIICIDGVNPNIGLKALKYSMRNVDFKEAKIVSHIKPDDLPDNIQFCQIEPLTHDTVSSWTLHELYKYVDTDYCLTIHDDGFVINPHLWTNEFLNYDYIGAPWFHTIPYYGPIHRVGNGGFSLRSKKLINLCKNLNYTSGHEDGIICLRNRLWFEAQGCKFSPVEIAMKFSLEEEIPECEFNLNNCFGFHGRGISLLRSENHNQQLLDRIKLLESV